MSDRQRRHGRLFERLTETSELENAWLAVLAHYRAGERPAEIAEFHQSYKSRLENLRDRLVRERYEPEPAALVAIPKPNHPGETRQISLLRVEDRIVLTALHRVLEPLFERLFSPHAYAFRRGRGVGDAARAVEAHLRAGRRQIAGADLDNFFDSIDRRRLATALRQILWEKPILELIETYLAMGSVRRKAGVPEWVDTGKGVAQGSPLSPLLASVYLLPFDRFLDTLRPAWIRYADEFLFMDGSREAVAEALDQAVDFLRRELDLRINGDSRRLTSDRDGFVFLGFLFQHGRRTLSPARIEEMGGKLKTEIRALAGDIVAGIRELSGTLGGWKRYYQQALKPDQWLHLDALCAEEMSRKIARLRAARQAPPLEDLERALREMQPLVERGAEERTAWARAILANRELAAPAPATGPAAQARKAVARRKRQLVKVRQELAEVVVTQPGVFLGRRGDRLIMRHDGEQISQIPLSAVRHITILERAGSISGDLIVELAARGISIHYIGDSGRPDVRIGPVEAPQFELSLLQLQAAGSEKGLDLARRFVLGKIGNQGNLLRYFLKYRQRGNESFQSLAREALDKMAAIEKDLLGRVFGTDIALERNRLFASEGEAATLYWRALKELLRSRAPFAGRERKGAKDLVNSLLNYGYGILYSRLLHKLTKAGLNPNVSFLHSPRTGKPTLLFDFIEEFRAPAVDRVVCALLGRRVALSVKEAGLDPQTRQRIAREVLRGFQKEVRYHGEMVLFEKVLDEQAMRLVRHLEGKTPYEAFVMPW